MSDGHDLPGFDHDHDLLGGGDLISEDIEGLEMFTLRSVGIDPRTQSFTIKITGGPDGDVAGNEIRILHRDYGANDINDNFKIVGISCKAGVRHAVEWRDIPVP